MPLMHGKSKKVIGHNIHEMVAAGHPQKQAVAASLHEADESKHMAEGGEVDEEHEGMMDQVAKEAMAAINGNDHAGFRDSMHVLMADLLNKMSSEED